MSLQTLDRILIEPKQPANAVMIWLHGLGSNGDDLAPLASMLKLNQGVNMRFIFPHAPVRPVKLSGGTPMTAWYDLEIHGHERKVVTEDLEYSSDQVLAIIEDQIQQGIPSDRIVVAGFSQGGAVTYETLFRCPYPLAAAIPMSTYIGNMDTLSQAKFKKTPVWVSHGTADDVVPFELGTRAFEALKSSGFAPSFKEYTMAHSVSPAQIKDIQAFLNSVLD